MKRKDRIAVLFLLTSSFLLLVSPVSAQYRCDWNLVASGGTRITAANLIASVSVAQTAIGFIEGANRVASIGFWVIDTLIVGIKEASSPKSPLKTEVYPPRPNPFTKETKIFYSLAEESDVSILLYNTCGQIVKKLFVAKQKPGIYSFSFAAKDEANRLLPKGIYFYKFQAGDYKKVKKLILVK